MADYSDAYSVGDRYLDHAGYRPPASERVPAREKKVKTKVTRTVTLDLGSGPYTVGDFLDVYEDLKELDPAAKVSINYGDSQRDGSWFKITVTQ